MSTFDPVCSLVTETGRVTVSERLLIRTHDGVRDELVLADDAEVLTAYRTNVGIELGRVPCNEPALSRLRLALEHVRISASV